nr:copper amine oxidase N-terminal domain-containing protein [Phosphitispora fastidiosa]
MEFSVQPIVKDGRTLVPMRAIFNKLGATVNWEEATQTVTAHTYYADVTLQIGSKTAQVNGRDVTLDIAPQIVDGSTLVPLRFISESLGATVRWNPNLMLAIIENKKVQ